MLTVPRRHPPFEPVRASASIRPARSGHLPETAPEGDAEPLPAPLGGCELDKDLAKLRPLADSQDDASFTRAWRQLLATPRVQAITRVPCLSATPGPARQVSPTSLGGYNGTAAELVARLAVVDRHLLPGKRQKRPGDRWFGGQPE